MRALSGTKRRVMSLKRIAGLRVPRAALLLLLVLLAAAMLRVERSFLVEAETSFADLTFGGELNTWSFVDGTICVPKEVPDVDAQGGGPCNAVLYDLYVPQESRDEAGPYVPPEPNPITLGWSCGARISLQTDPDGALVATVLGFDEVEAQGRPCRGDGSRAFATGHDFGPGTIIVVPGEAWRVNGALPFQAEVTLGEDIGPGSLHYLQEGRWEARQKSVALELLGLPATTEVVKTGAFSIGAEATIHDAGMQSVMFGQITPVAVDWENSLPGFDVVMVSSPGDTELRLAYFGLADTVSIRPNWIDIVINSPTFLAIFTILSLFAVVLQIAGDWPFWPGKKREKPKDAGAAGED